MYKRQIFHDAGVRVNGQMGAVLFGGSDGKQKNAITFVSNRGNLRPSQGIEFDGGIHGISFIRRRRLLLSFEEREARLAFLSLRGGSAD